MDAGKTIVIIDELGRNLFDASWHDWILVHYVDLMIFNLMSR